MDLQLKGKKAIVTGGSAGIELEIARTLAQEGVEVTIPWTQPQEVSLEPKIILVDSTI